MPWVRGSFTNRLHQRREVNCPGAGTGRSTSQAANRGEAGPACRSGWARLAPQNSGHL